MFTLIYWSFKDTENYSHYNKIIFIKSKYALKAIVCKCGKIQSVVTLMTFPNSVIKIT